MMDSVIVSTCVIIVTMNIYDHSLDNTIIGKRIEENAIQLISCFREDRNGIFKIRRNGYTGIIPDTTKRLILHNVTDYCTEENTLTISNLPNLEIITIGQCCLQTCITIQIKGMEPVMAMMNRS